MDVDEEVTELPIFSWWVEEFVESFIRVRLDFENPQLVSTNSHIGDTLVIRINDPRLVVDE